VTDGPAIETASWGRRILALFVDWIASTLAVIAVLGPDGWLDDRYAGTYTMGVFLLETTLLTALTGGSFGKLATGLRVATYAGDRVWARPPDLLRCAVRQLLICLVIPPLVFRPDGRGLHDLAAGSATVPRGVFDEVGGSADRSPGRR
jgi:uncharacterized RDD family membrane protein YckC